MFIILSSDIIVLKYKILTPILHKSAIVSIPDENSIDDQRNVPEKADIQISIAIHFLILILYTAR
ncbi:hypothetical protein GCM10028803_44260 [Larkinella knui]